MVSAALVLFMTVAGLATITPAAGYVGPLLA